MQQMFIKFSLCARDHARNQEYCDEQKNTLQTRGKLWNHQAAHFPLKVKKGMDVQRGRHSDLIKVTEKGKW